MTKIATVILAAGKGTRMESDLPKVLHTLNNRPMVHYVIDVAKKIGSEKIILVIGHKKQLVIDSLNDQDVEFAVQSPQLGTGHALLQAGSNLEKFDGNVLVLSGDVPLLQVETLNKLIKLHEEADSSATLLTTLMDDPSGYGRVVRDEQGLVKQIVEEKDADEKIRQIKEINVGIYVFKAKKLFETLPLIKNDNQQGEYYLPDVLKIYVNQGDKPAAVLTTDVRETHGINTIDQLKNAEKILLDRMEKPVS
ncbi:MAG: NTP transferase domain-containing protein [Desulfobacterales bacterium]|nr:NTP transferase domain-containing protein [Desulfobacterales bacterium]